MGKQFVQQPIWYATYCKCTDFRAWINIWTRPVSGKSNEISATQRLIKMLKIKGCVVVEDALNCQKATATAIIEQDADYFLSVKGNHPNLKQDIENFVQDEHLRVTMETANTKEKIVNALKNVQPLSVTI